MVGSDRWKCQSRSSKSINRIYTIWTYNWCVQFLAMALGDPCLTPTLLSWMLPLERLKTCIKAFSCSSTCPKSSPSTIYLLVAMIPNVCIKTFCCFSCSHVHLQTFSIIPQQSLRPFNRLGEWKIPLMVHIQSHPHTSRIWGSSIHP